jgi:prepilin signal peptidase PulO-like enzyme (type II secretory pathway)
MLGGRCRNCRKPISWQYPVVEALTGALFVLAFLKFYGPSFQLAVVEFLVVASILISGIDIWTYTIPDKIVLPFLVIAVCLAPLNSLLGEQWLKRLSAGFAGILIGGGVLFFLGWVGAKIFGKEAMGGGDIKLLAAFGAFLGWEKVLDGLFLGSLICALLGLVLLLSGQLKPKSPLPFGPFLCAGCLLALFFEKLRLIVWFWG